MGWGGVWRGWSSLEFGLLGTQGVWVAAGSLGLEVAKTLAKREVEKHLKANFNLSYLFILPHSGPGFLSSWLVYFLFLKWALINSSPLSR